MIRKINNLIYLGYTGFIPRIAATDLGLGATYHNTTKKGLLDFKNNYIFTQSAK